MPGRLREQWDRVVASDPGLSRLRMAGSSALGMASALGVEYLFAKLTGATGPAILIAMMLGAIVAMMGSMALTGGQVWPKIRTALFFPVAIGTGMLLGVLFSGHAVLMLVVFVLVMFFAVFIRRFGIPYFFYGFMGWMGYFLAMFTHATMGVLPALLGAVVVGSAWVLLLSITVLSTNPTRSLRRTVRAFDARARAVSRAGADLLERAGYGMSVRRAVRTLRRQQDRLAEVALMVEAWSGEPGALPEGWSGAGLRRRLIDAQQTVESMAAAADALAEGNPWLAAKAVPVLDLLARRDDIRANRAAHQLAEFAEDAENRCLSGWWPARHLSVAALEFVALARNAEIPPADEEVDGFEPTVNLVFGNLPGSPAVAKDVPSRHVNWNPLARLDMTTRQAIQVAVAGGLAIVAGKELSDTRYYWAVLAAFLMFTGTSTRSEAFIKGFNRVFGTLAGLLVSIWFAELTAGNTAMALVVIVASMFCGMYLMRISYAYMIFFLTIMLGQLYTMLHEFSGGFLVLRLEETAIGAGIGFLVALLLVPLSTRDTVRSARDALLGALAELLRAVQSRLNGTSGEADLDALARGLDDRFRQLALVAKPLTRPLVWGNSPLRTRHRLALYAAVTSHARALTVAARSSVNPLDGSATACGALAIAASEIAEIPAGHNQPAAAEPLAEADAALFATGNVVPGMRATDPVLRPLIRLHHLLKELALPKQLLAPEAVAAEEALATRIAEQAPAPLVERESAPDDSAMLTGVINTADRAEVPHGALVLLLDAQGSPAARVRVDEQGRYRVAECLPGRYVVAVTAEGYQPNATRVTVSAGQITRADITIVASRRPVAGIVYGPGGPLRDVSVTLLDEAGVVVAGSRTDSCGRYRMPALPSGDYTLVASGYSPNVTTTRLCAGKNRVLDLSLSPAPLPGEQELANIR